MGSELLLDEDPNEGCEARRGVEADDGSSLRNRDELLSSLEDEPGESSRRSSYGSSMIGGGDDSGEELHVRRSPRRRGRGVPRVMVGGDEAVAAECPIATGVGVVLSCSRGSTLGRKVGSRRSADWGSTEDTAGSGSAVTMPWRDSAVLATSILEGVAELGWPGGPCPTSCSFSAAGSNCWHDPSPLSVDCWGGNSGSAREIRRRFVGRSSSGSSGASTSLLVVETWFRAASNWAWINEYRPFSERKS